MSILDTIQKASQRSKETILGSFGIIEKARSGIYSDNAVNRKLKRVGQKYGSGKQEEKPIDKPKKQQGQPKKYDQKKTEEYAKKATDEQLKLAVEKHDDPMVKEVAKKELESRNNKKVVKPLFKNPEHENNFKKWFDNSKVVDENGKPKIVYHATQNDFSSFSEDTIGSSIDFGTVGSGFYFTDEIENVNNYARNLSSNTGKEGGENIIPAYLSIQKPYELNDPRKFSGMNEKESKKFVEKLKNKGYDGIMVEFGSYREPIRWFVAFNSNQIKSAIGNKGTFDPNSDDITKSEV